MYNFTVNIV